MSQKFRDFNMLNSSGKDVYLFKKNGLVKKLNDIQDIQGYIGQYHPQEVNALSVKYYCSSYGNTCEGGISNTISQLIHYILVSDVDEFKKWIQLYGRKIAISSFQI